MLHFKRKKINVALPLNGKGAIPVVRTSSIDNLKHFCNLLCIGDISEYNTTAMITMISNTFFKNHDFSRIIHQLDLS